MPAVPAPALQQPIDPLSLPDVWRVEDLAREEAVLASGHAALDAQLPGGGWPLGSLVEVLHHRRGGPVWQLVLPALKQAVSASPGPVVLVGCPHLPFGPSLQAQGLAADRLLCIHADKPATRLWATEQALKCAEVAAVLSWLPRSQSAQLRRLQMAAQSQGRLTFVLREASSLQQASPARLRLLLGEGPGLDVRIVKRRGPPVDTTIVLRRHPQRLADLLQSRRQRARLPFVPARVEETRPPVPSHHVLDRTAALP